MSRGASSQPASHITGAHTHDALPGTCPARVHGAAPPLLVARHGWPRSARRLGRSPRALRADSAGGSVFPTCPAFAIPAASSARQCCCPPCALLRCTICAFITPSSIGDSTPVLSDLAAPCGIGRCDLLSARVPLWSRPLQASRVDAAVLNHASVSLGLCPVVGVRSWCAGNDPSGDRRAGQSASGNMASGLNSSSRRPSLARRRRGALHHSFWRLRSCASSCARLGHLLGRRLAPSRRSQHGRPGHTVRFSCRRALGRAKTCTLPGQDAAAVSTRGLSASPMARLDWHNLPGGIHGAISPIAPSSSPRFRPLRSPASKWAAFVRRETHKGRKRHVSFARSLSLNFSLILLSTLMDMLRN